MQQVLNFCVVLLQWPEVCACYILNFLFMIRSTVLHFIRPFCSSGCIRIHYKNGNYVISFYSSETNLQEACNNNT